MIEIDTTAVTQHWLLCHLGLYQFEFEFEKEKRSDAESDWHPQTDKNITSIEPVHHRDVEQPGRCLVNFRN